MLIVKTLQGTFGSERLGELLWVAARCGVGWVGSGGSWWWYKHRPRFSGHWLQERDSDAGFPPLQYWCSVRSMLALWSAVSLPGVTDVLLL